MSSSVHNTQYNISFPEESSQNVTTTVSAAVQQMVSDKLQGKHLFLKSRRFYTHHLFILLEVYQCEF